MKKITTLLLGLVLVMSCSSDDDSNSSMSSQLTANVNGAPFTNSQIGATLFNNLLNITVLNSNGDQILININSPSVNTFDIGEDNPSMSVGAYSPSGENAYLSLALGGSGEVTITALDMTNQLVSGTFNFMAVRQINVSQTESVNITGSFTNLSYTTQIGGNSNNSFSADIDGTPLNPDSVNAVSATIVTTTTITISAINNSTGQNIALSFPEGTMPGTYNFSNIGDYRAIYTLNLGVGASSYVPNPGTLTITNYDASNNTYEGSFEFTATRLTNNDPDITYQITNGTFSAQVQ